MPDYRASGWIGRCIRKTRLCVGEVSVNSTVNDDDLLSFYLEPAWAEVYEHFVMSTGHPLIARHQISVEQGRQFYELPPNMARLLFVGKIDENDIIPLTDYVPRGRYNTLGHNWRVNGRTLDVVPPPAQTETWDILYIPSGDMRLHEGTLSGASATTLTLGATPSFGELDRRANAYGGAMLRITDSSLSKVYELSIESYEPSTRVATVRYELPSEVSSGTDLEYEIIPSLGYNQIDVVAYRAAMKLLVQRDHQRGYGLMQDEYRAAMKALRSQASAMQSRVPPRLERDSRRVNQTFYGYWWG